MESCNLLNCSYLESNFKRFLTMWWCIYLSEKLEALKIALNAFLVSCVTMSYNTVNNLKIRESSLPLFVRKINEKI